MTKKKRMMLAEKARLADEAAKQKEFEDRIRAKSTLNKMHKEIDSLSTYKVKYLEKARQALTVGNKEAYSMARSSLKLCLSKQRVLETMITNFEAAIDATEMNQIVSSFVDGINVLSGQLQNVTSSYDFTKAESAFNEAMLKNATQYEALNAFMESATEGIGTLDATDNSISDKDVDAMISNAAADKASTLVSDSIQTKIGDLDKMLKDN
jgi:hypothetical protein